MTTSGLFSPTEVLRRVGANDWVYDDDFTTVDGNALLRPTSISYVGTSASIVGRGSVEFTAVSSLSLNGVFSATYDNYMVVCRYVGSTTGQMRIRFRVAGADNSTANSYVLQYLTGTGTLIDAARTTSDLAKFSILSSSQRNGLTAYFYGPNLVQPTAFRSITINGLSDARLDDHAGTHNQSTAYDGFTLIAESGNFTGLVSVYGLVGA